MHVKPRDKKSFINQWCLQYDQIYPLHDCQMPNKITLRVEFGAYSIHHPDISAKHPGE